MHTYHGDGLETKYLAICGDRFRLLNVTPFARELRATRVHAQQELQQPVVHATETTHLHIHRFIFFRYRAICGSAAASLPSPTPDPSMREIARRLRLSQHFRVYQSLHPR